MLDILGYAASVAVLTTFLMRTMLPLRFVAISSNILFLIYGYCAHILPVLFLHATLLPINVARLMALQERAYPRQCEAFRRFATIIGSRCGFIQSDANIGSDEQAKSVVVAESERLRRGS
jgi:hypothetical protein